MGLLLVGIDPDTKASGVALWDKDNKQLLLHTTMSFFELFDLLNDNKRRIQMVRVEAGWLHAKSNFHDRAGQTKQSGERIAKFVGSNHETGRKILEMCEYLEVPAEPVLPLGKVNAPYFSAVTKIKRSNQEVRDAVMLVWGM